MKANVGIDIRANGFTLKGNNSNEILAHSHINQVTFLQTDRQTYKPGDIFKIRILILNKDGFASKEKAVVLQTFSVCVLNDSSCRFLW